MDDVNKLGLPIVLLAALWGAVNTTLSFFEIINTRRDMMFELVDSCGYCIEKTLGPVEIYFTNLLPLTIGNIIFLGLIWHVILSIPHHMKITDDTEAKRLQAACKTIALLPAFGMLGFVGGGIFDMVMLIRTLSS